MWCDARDCLLSAIENVNVCRNCNYKSTSVSTTQRTSPQTTARQHSLPNNQLFVLRLLSRFPGARNHNEWLMTIFLDAVSFETQHSVTVHGFSSEECRRSFVATPIQFVYIYSFQLMLCVRRWRCDSIANAAQRNRNRILHFCLFSDWKVLRWSRNRILRPPDCVTSSKCTICRRSWLHCR